MHAAVLTPPSSSLPSLLYCISLFLSPSFYSNLLSLSLFLSLNNHLTPPPSLEYKMLIVEQLSEHRERAMVAAARAGTPPPPATAPPTSTSTSATSNPSTLPIHTPKFTPLPGGTPDRPLYGTIVNTCVIRDLGGVGFEHVGHKGQEIIQAVIAIASPNYPELMRKCFMINSPWVFNALWFFIKGLLPARTVAKVDLMGSGFKKEIEEEISMVRG